MSTVRESATEFVCNNITSLTFEKIPEKTRIKAKWLILDCIGNMCGGSNTEPGRIVKNIFESQGGLESSTVVSSGKKIPMLNAAYVNAHTSNMLDYDDTYPGAGHPGSVCISSALAAAESSGASGKEFLTAVVLGYETGLRIAAATAPSPERTKKNMRMGVLTFCSVAAGAFIYKLSSIETNYAITLGGGNSPIGINLKCMEEQYRPINWIKNNHGWIAQAGLLAVMLASEGFKSNTGFLDEGEFYSYLSGSDRFNPDLMLKDFGEEYLTDMVGVKPYASCRNTHSAIEALEMICEGHNIVPEEIDKIEIESFEELVNHLCSKEPKDIIDAQFSMPYLAALIISRYSPKYGLSEDNLRDEIVLKTSQKVKLIPNEGYTKMYILKTGLPAKVTVTMKDNSSYTQEIIHPKGSENRPLSETDLKWKFFSLAEPVIGLDNAQRMFEYIMNLEKVEDISAMMDFVYSRS